jgi:outer membrane protein OmpA-like peptidoglycan-associated protein
MFKNLRTISLFLVISVGFTSCETLSKYKNTMGMGLIGCATGLLAGVAYDELARKAASDRKNLMDDIKGAFKKKKANNKGKVVGLAAGCAAGLGVGLYFDLMKDDIKTDLEAKKIGVNEVKGTDGIEALNLLLGEQAVKFDAGRATIPEGGKGALNSIAETLKAYPDTKINISGHTDGTGDANLNKTLSQNRANAVRDYLVNEAKLPTSQIGDVEGKGATQLIPGASASDGKNRRVEMAVTAG